MEEKYTATVKWFNRDRGYGFAIVDDIEQEIIIHYSTIEMDGFRYVNADQEITIEGIEETKEGLRAKKIIV